MNKREWALTKMVFDAKIVNLGHDFEIAQAELSAAKRDNQSADVIETKQALFDRAYTRRWAWSEAFDFIKKIEEMDV